MLAARMFGITPNSVLSVWLMIGSWISAWGKVQKYLRTDMTIAWGWPGGREDRPGRRCHHIAPHRRKRGGVTSGPGGRPGPSGASPAAARRPSGGQELQGQVGGQEQVHQGHDRAGRPLLEQRHARDALPEDDHRLARDPGQEALLGVRGLLEQGAQELGPQAADALAPDHVGVDVHAGDLGRVLLHQHHPEDGRGREDEQLDLGDDVGEGVRLVRTDPVGQGRHGRQELVERLVEAADHQAQDGRDGHGDPHVERGLLRPLARVVGEEGEVRDLDAGVLEHARAGEEQDHPQPGHVQLGRRDHDHGLGHEGAEAGDRADRCGSHQTQAHGLGHGLVQPAQLGALGRPQAVVDRAHGHEQEALEDHVREGVGHRAVEGQVRAEPDADDHEADLVDHRVAQDAPEVVLDDRVEDREQAHHRAHVDQGLLAAEAAREAVHRRLGGEGRQEQGAGGGGGRVGVDDPVVEDREADLDAEGQEDQPGGHGVQLHGAEGEGPGVRVQERGAEEQQEARADVGQEVAPSRSPRLGGTRGPDLEDAGDGQELPEQE